jgi:two-component system, NtrC family, response regulator AtoC
MKQSTSILIVDDDTSLRSCLFSVLSSRGYAAVCAESGSRALALLEGGYNPAAIILDMVMPEMDGLEVLDRINSLGRKIPVVILSGTEHTKTVVQAMQHGASDFLIKPFEESAMLAAIERTLVDKQQAVTQVEFTTSNPTMIQINDIGRRVADKDVPVLILGESGTGKEVLARYIHEQSRRRDHTFVKVNCAALPADLLESELFGYVRGAFTGADKDKPGKFELAHKGTLMLDEIGEMSAHLQAKLLHVLQDGEYSSLGGSKTLKVDARIIAATNVNIVEFVKEGKFREDLYYRLNVVKLQLPPLRNRGEDIPNLCRHFVAKYAERYKSSVTALPPALMEAFRNYRWAGNIREMENLIKRYVILPDAESIIAELEGKYVSSSELPEASPIAAVTAANAFDLKSVGGNAAQVAEMELVARVLRESGGNRKKAAKELGICYKALLNKLKRWRPSTPNAA